MAKPDGAETYKTRNRFLVRRVGKVYGSTDTKRGDKLGYELI